MEQNNQEETKPGSAEGLRPKSEGKVPPPYGSKEYWDQRYEKLLVTQDKKRGEAGWDDENNSNVEQKDDENSNNDDPVAFHSWYFSYDDLKPIILSLILGGKEEYQRRFGETEDDEDNEDDDDDDDDDDGEENVHIKESTPQTNKNATNSKQDKTHAKTPESDKGAPGDSEEGEDGWEEVEGDHSEEIEEDEEVSQTETGISVEGPMAVLEVGCGDVPLVLGLAEDLVQLEVSNSKNSKQLVDRLVCTDYSTTLIRTLERIHRKKRKLPCSAGDSNSISAIAKSKTVETNTVEIQYMVADARDLPFPDNSFHLILEKGTMDAMISDAEVGVSNCIGIVSDCARVLAAGGCFFLVSHINGHTSKGEEWLEDVVLKGLREGGGDASWNIEVHGNDHLGANDSNDDDANDAPEAAGPAVYLIFKGLPHAQNKDSFDQPAIPINFFCY